MSRLRSGRGASSASPKARSSGGARGVYVQSPKSDIFVALLGIALGAMIIGCLLLLLVWGRYDYKTKVSALLPASTTTASLAFSEFDKIGTVRL